MENIKITFFFSPKRSALRISEVRNAILKLAFLTFPTLAKASTSCLEFLC